MDTISGKIEGPSRGIAKSFDELLHVKADVLLDGLMQFVPIGLSIAHGPEVAIVRVSDAGARLLSRPGNGHKDISSARHEDAYRLSDPETGDFVDPARLPLTRATLHGEVVQGETWLITAEDGRKIPILCDAGPLKDESGRIVAGVMAWTDLTRRRQLEADLVSAQAVHDTLMRELHHRVRNHLHIVASIIRNESRGCSGDAQALVARLSQRLDALSDSYGALEAKKVGGVAAARLLHQVCLPLNTDRIAIAIAIEADDDIEVSPAGVPILGIIVNEAVCNAIKHAFPGDRSGSVTVSLKRRHEGFRLEVSDDGQGLSGKRARAGGTALIEHLAQVLGGSVELRNNEAQGLMFSVDLARL